MKKTDKIIITKEKLLNAGKELFSAKKIEDVSVREICSLAGMTTGNFYYLFDGKSDFIDQIYRNKDSFFGETLKDMCKEGPYIPKIVQFFSQWLGAQVEQDGVDFTSYRLFTMRKHSSVDNRLYIGMIELINCAIKEKELSSESSASDINDFLFLVFRGAVYEWCISTEEKSYNLTTEIHKNISRALLAYRPD